MRRRDESRARGLAVTGLKGGADEAAMAGAQLAAVTHGHELGYIPAAQLAYIVALAVEGESLPYAVEKSRVAMKRLFPHAVHLSEADRLMEKAVDLAMSDVGDRDAVAALGEGWVGEEALAIAVYCALRHGEDIGAALAAAVNHSGDSDSTGAVTGNILGAFFGERAVPRRFTERLELADLLKESAVALADEAERERYGMRISEKTRTAAAGLKLNAMELCFYPLFYKNTRTLPRRNGYVTATGKEKCWTSIPKAGRRRKSLCSCIYTAGVGSRDCAPRAAITANTGRKTATSP